MASIKNYVNGVGGSTGAELATIAPFQSSGSIWYLGNATAGASDANVGNERAKPLATLSVAYGAASAGDIIDILPGHSEILSAAVTLNKAGLSVIGEGSGTLVPTFTLNNGSNCITTTAACMLDNLKFINTTAAGIMLQTGALTIGNNLVFTCGTGNVSFSPDTGSDGSRFTNMTFTAGLATSQPAISMPHALADLTMDNIVIDGASYAWATYSWRMDGAQTRLRATNIQLLNGSDILAVTGTTGYLHISEQSGSSKVDWTA